MRYITTVGIGPQFPHIGHLGGRRIVAWEVKTAVCYRRFFWPIEDGAQRREGNMLSLGIRRFSREAQNEHTGSVEFF